MSKISEYPLRTLVSGEEFVVAIGGKNYRVVFDNLIPKGHLHGLTLSNNVADATNDIDIAIGEAKDTGNSVVMKLASALVKRLDATWVAGTNQGMRSSSLAISDTTWHIFLMRVGGTDDVGADTSATGANLVIDHSATNLRRIGSIVRTGGSIKAFKQDGDKFIWSVPVNDVTATNPGTGNVTRTLTVPIGIRVEAIVGVWGASAVGAADNTQGVYVSDLSIAPTAASQNCFTMYEYSGSGSAQLGAQGNHCKNQMSAR